MCIFCLDGFIAEITVLKLKNKYSHAVMVIKCVEICDGIM